MATPAKQLARSGGISYQELIAQDVVPPPRTLTLENAYDGGPVTVPVHRYTTQAYHDLEMQKLWPKVRSGPRLVVRPGKPAPSSPWPCLAWPA